MAETTTSLEQRKYLQSIVGTSDTGNMNPFDQSQPGLTGSGEAGTEGAQEKDLVDLPFRFTQWQLNAGNKAATGQWDRSGIARSPFQSGQLALEMEGIQSQLKNLPEMNAAPTPPELPQDPQIPSVATDEATRSIGPNENMNMRYGLPIKEYQIPSNMILGSRNPIDAARAFEAKYKTPEERAAFGPMTSLQGYDVDTLMKSSGWGGNLTEKYGGDENRATQTFFKNLGLLPATFDPNLGSKDTVRNLSSQDFTYNNQPIQYDPPQLTWVGDEQGRWVDTNEVSRGEGQGGAPMPQNGRLAMTDEEWDQQFKFGQAGEAGTVGQTGFGEFENQAQETIKRELMNGNAISKVAKTYGLAATIAVMAAMTGGAASVAAAPAAGATAGATSGAATGAAAGETAATGIAGAMGMSAGAGATTVNTVASLIAKYGISTAAQMAGVPVDNPMFQLAMAAAGGAYSGATGAAPGGATAGAPVEEMPGSDFMRGDINMGGLDTAQPSGASNLVEGMSSGMETPRNVFAMDNGYVPGFEGASSAINYKELGNKAGQFGIKVGMNELAQSGAEDLQSQSGSGEQLSDPGSFDNEMASYNAELESYNQQVAQYEAYKKQLEERSAEVQRLMGAYEKDSGNWAARQSLIARQSGIQQQIQDSISGNKAYDPNARSTGVQGALWR